MRNLCLIAAAYYLVLTGVTQLLLSRPVVFAPPRNDLPAHALARR